MKALLLTRDLPNLAYGSGKYKVSICEALASKGIEVVWSTTLFNSQEEVTVSGKVLASRNVRFKPMPDLGSRKTANFRRQLRKAVRAASLQPTAIRCDQYGLPIFRSDKMAPAELAYAKQLVASERPDVIIADCVWMCEIFDHPESGGAKKVVITQDVVSARNKSFIEEGEQPTHSMWNATSEAQFYNKADLLLAIQEDEAKLLRQMCPAKKVITASVAFDVPEYVPSPEHGPLLLVASDADHNVSGAQWFLEKVWPLILQDEPSAELKICGSICRKIDVQKPRVQKLGFVDDLQAEYRKAAVTTAPLLMGSGVKIKVVESLANSRVNVSTKVGAQGLGTFVGNGLFEAQNEQEMATDVVTLLQSPRKRHDLEEKTYAAAVEQLSPQSVYKELVAQLL